MVIIDRPYASLQLKKQDIFRETENTKFEEKTNIKKLGFTVKASAEREAILVCFLLL